MTQGTCEQGPVSLLEPPSVMVVSRSVLLLASHRLTLGSSWSLMSDSLLVETEWGDVGRRVVTSSIRSHPGIDEQVLKNLQAWTTFQYREN